MAKDIHSKNGKFEAMLRRNLEPDVYRDIRVCEPVIIKRKNNLSYKQLIVTGTQAIVMDRKSFLQTMLFDIAHIKSVSMLNDSAEFLQPFLQRSSTHICVNVTKKERGSKKFKWKYSKFGNSKTPNRSEAQNVSGKTEDELNQQWNHPTGSADLKSPSDSVIEVLERVRLKKNLPKLDSVLPNMDALTRSLSANDAYELCNKVPERKCRSELSQPVYKNNSKLSRISQSLHSLADENNSNEKNFIHIYTLKMSSCLFDLLHALWIEWLLNGLELNAGKSRGLSCIKEEEVESTFQGLLHELIKTTELESKFETLKKLRVAIYKCNHIRSLFFKDGRASAFLLMVLQLASNPITAINEEDLLQRKQELQQVILAAYSVFNTAFSMSHGCPFKRKLLHSKNFTKDFIGAIVKPLQLADPYDTTCERFLQDFSQLTSLCWQMLPEKELLVLKQEVIRNGAISIYYVLEGIREDYLFNLQRNQVSVSSFDNANSSFHIAVSELFKGTSITNWLSYVLAQLFYVINSGRANNSLTPQEINFVFQSVSGIRVLVENVNEALEFCRKHFTEEIKYYLSKSFIQYCFNETELKCLLTIDAQRIQQAVDPTV